MALDHLWTGGKGGPKSWYERVSPEVQQFCNDLADLIVLRGQEPVWASALAHVQAEWPEQAPRTWNAIAHAVRGLVEERV